MLTAGSSPNVETVNLALAISGIICGLIGAWLGYRGQARSSKVNEITGVFDGQDKLIKNLQTEVARLHTENDEVRKAMQEQATKQDEAIHAKDAQIDECLAEHARLRAELSRVLSDFAGLRMIVSDEIAKAAATVTEDNALDALSQPGVGPEPEGESGPGPFAD